MKPSHVWEACLRTQPNSPSVIAVYCQIAKISLNVEYDYCSAVERICFCCTHEGPARARRQAGLAKIQPASVTPWKESARLSACPFGREGSRAFLDQTKDPSSLVHSFYPVILWEGLQQATAIPSCPVSELSPCIPAVLCREGSFSMFWIYSWFFAWWPLPHPQVLKPYERVKKHPFCLKAAVLKHIPQETNPPEVNTTVESRCL